MPRNPGLFRLCRICRRLLGQFRHPLLRFLQSQVLRFGLTIQPRYEVFCLVDSLPSFNHQPR